MSQKKERQQGTVVQLVRAPPCHGGSCGFEPRQSRSKVNNQETGFLIKLIATNQDILRNPVSEGDRKYPKKPSF
uniref:Uncharacterized protein n=1 Tax=Planktothrix agardhii TaxID=1160 RepID=A0A1J1JIX1_PLAAG|nr:protein of unknown function [Planktothrix agardhii]